MKTLCDRIIVGIFGYNTLNILNSLKALRTERPKEPPFTSDHTTSKMEPDMTTQSKRLNEDSK